MIFVGNANSNTEEGTGVSVEGDWRDEELPEGHKRLDGQGDGEKLTTIFTSRSFLKPF